MSPGKPEEAIYSWRCQQFFFPVSRWVCRLGRIRPGKDASGAVVVYRMIHWFVEGCLAPVCSAKSTASTNQDAF
eukprot:g28623.t1